MASSSSKSVPERFHQAITKLEPTQEDIQLAIELHTQLRQSLQLHLKCETFLTGSYARHTAVNPLHDVDIFVVLPQTSMEAQDVVKALGEITKKALASIAVAHVRLQRRSVGVKFEGVDVTFDLVPALERESGYAIPDCEVKFWLQTDPKKAMEDTTAANAACNGRLLPLIKVMKHWNQRMAKEVGGEPVKPLKSFHLEVMCCSYRTPDPYDDRRGITFLFQHLLRQVDGILLGKDPSPLTAYLTNGHHPHDVRKLLEEARQLAVKATMLETSNPAQAHAIWSQLLGDVY